MQPEVAASPTPSPAVLPVEFKHLPVKSLKPHELNANRGDEVSILDSVDRNGFFGAVLVQRSTNRIICGKNRWQAAKKRGIKEIPALLYDVDDAQALQIMLADNQTNRLGKDDPAMLSQALSLIKSNSGSIKGTGFTDSQFREILKQARREPVQLIPDSTGAPSDGPQENTQVSVHPTQHGHGGGEVNARSAETSGGAKPDSGSPAGSFVVAMVLTAAQHRNWLKIRTGKDDRSFLIEHFGLNHD